MNMHVNPTLLAATAMNYKANPHTLETKMDHQPLALSDVNEDNFSKEQMEYFLYLAEINSHPNSRTLLADNFEPKYQRHETYFFSLFKRKIGELALVSVITEDAKTGDREETEYCGILIDCHADYAVLEEPVSGEQFVFKGCRCMPDEFGIYRIINTLGVLQWADLRKKVPPRSN
ncbi:hypothetical protein SAMN04488056_10288 [Cohaesibacter marisflavi]|uniref:Uncharacterized protein n=1 Tax=Cohaesibacter marisflavi TaxID=655353 RepID=A0A1I5C1X7_9HYPH|nr:hypothetical protein [Cohaesibacter marisflavi]SFN81023.1 hypothetical protein SAMN04488056_10288 [Cohaesibacter marisflavi]